MGRPRLPEGQTKVEAITVLFTKREAAWVLKLAGREGASISGWCRSVILETLHREAVAAQTKAS